MLQLLPHLLPREGRWARGFLRFLQGLRYDGPLQLWSIWGLGPAWSTGPGSSMQHTGFCVSQQLPPLSTTVLGWGAPRVSPLCHSFTSLWGWPSDASYGGGGWAWRQQGGDELHPSMPIVLWRWGRWRQPRHGRRLPWQPQGSNLMPRKVNCCPLAFHPLSPKPCPGRRWRQQQQPLARHGEEHKDVLVAVGNDEEAKAELPTGSRAHTRVPYPACKLCTINAIYV
jgi:hypothetical protein